MSSRFAWMAAFTLEVSSMTSFLYFWFSFSSSVTFAFTMAIDSFIFGTWSFRSRMFCSRISSGSSAAEIIQPNIERNARFMRCHIAKPPEGRPLKAQLEIRGKERLFRRPDADRMPGAGRGLPRVGARLRARGPPRVGDRTGQGSVRARSRGAPPGDRPGGHREPQGRLRADPRARGEAKAAQPHGPAGRRQAARAAPFPAGVVGGAACAVSRSVVEEAAPQATDGRRRFRPAHAL